jgi:hypothetical protein
VLNLLRKPLTWIVVLECAVGCGLALVAWHMITGAAAQNGAGPPAPQPVVSVPDSTAPSPPALPPAPSPTVRPLPGLNLDVGFWRVRLADLNSEEATFEALEWKIVHSCLDAAQRYVESVVVPAVVQAERTGA